MSFYTQAELSAMSIEKILFSFDYPEIEFAIRETRFSLNCLVFRADNPMVVRAIAVRVNAILSQFVGNFKSYRTEPAQQTDGRFYTVVPLKTTHKSDLPVEMVDRIVTNLVSKLGTTCHCETNPDVEPSNPWERGSDLHTTIDVEIVDYVPEDARPISEPMQINAGGKQKQATVKELRKHLGVKTGTKAQLLAQLR